MEMTLQERINRFCEKYPKPEQFEIQLNWKRTDGLHTRTLNSGANKLYTWAGTFTRSVGAPLYVYHCKYDEETLLMECSYAVIKCNTPKPNETTREWEYAERYFIPKEEKVIYDRNGEAGLYATHDCYGSNTGYGKTFLQKYARLNGNNEMFQKAFLALTDNSPDLPLRYIGRTKHPWIMVEWITHKPVNYNNSKTQNIIDTLSKDIPEVPQEIIDKIIEKYNLEANQSYWARSEYGYYDKKHNVYRVFSVSNGEALEVSRIYEHKKKFITAKYEKNKWVKNGSFTYSQFSAELINPEDIYEKEHMSYLKDLKCESIHKIVRTIRNPEIEQLFNMGCLNIAKRAANNDHTKSALEYIIGKPISKRKNVCQKYGITKKQLDFIDDSYEKTRIRYYYNGNGSIVDHIRRYLCVDSVSSLGDTFEKYYKTLRNSGYCANVFDRVPEEHRKKIFIKISNMSDLHPNATQILSDTISACNYLGRDNKPNIDIYGFRNYVELARLHDQILELRRIEQEEYNRLLSMKREEHNKELEKKMAKIDEERAKLNYEEDNFLIRIPTKLSEIVNEGSALHHCVGGYTDSHARGTTTILFLRRKSAPDSSFYTIELRNDNTIQQIHGFGNRWLGNDPDAIPTVARWLRKNNITCSDQILRGTARGYSGNNILVDMPEI